MSEPRLLFIPVSGEKGVGEYYRSLTIAEGARRRWPHAAIHFIVSRSAGYASDVPFPSVQVEGSPTFNTPAVNRAIDELRPHVVVFDSAGRVAQLRRARRVGARTVYVSSRPSARWKGFRLRRLRHLDQHWLAWPAFLESGLTAWERLKLGFARSLEIVHLDSVYPAADSQRAAAYRQILGLAGQDYLVFCAGGGGYEREGVPAAEIFAQAAVAVCREARVPAVWVRGPNYGGRFAGGQNLITLDAVSATQMVDLLSGARLGVINGGSLLLQALALILPCVAAPVAGDQHARIAGCAKRGLVVASELAPRALADASLQLLRSDDQMKQMSARLQALDLRNGVDQAVQALERLLTSEPA